MKRTLFFLLFIGYTFLVLSQELVCKQEVFLEKYFKEKREVYPVICENSISLFLTDRNSISKLSFDKGFTGQQFLTWELPDGPFDKIVGGGLFDNHEILFFSDKHGKELGNIEFRDSAPPVTNKLAIDLRNESIIDLFQHGNTFILISVINQANILRIYTFLNPSEYIVKNINFFDYRFTKNDELLFNALFFSENEPDFEIITHDQPHGIKMAAEAKKFYVEDRKMVFTFDSKPDKTILLSIEIPGYQWTIKEFSHPVISCGTTGDSQTNSFYMNNTLFQFYGCNGQFLLRGINTNNDSIIKEYLGFKGFEVDFMNSPVIQEGQTNYFPLFLGSVFRRKEVQKMNGFYRNLSAGKIGVDVYSRVDGLELMIGSYKEVSGGGGAPMLMGPSTMTVNPGKLSGLGPQTVHFGNPGMRYAMTNYNFTQATYFKSKLEKGTLKHLDGPVKPNAFDKMILFSDKEGSRIKVETVFKLDSVFYLGYYNKGEYFIYRFQDDE